MRTALLGGNLARLAWEKGWAGVVVHGAVRDTEELREVPIGLLALGALLLLWPRGLLEALPVGVLIGTGFGGVLVLGDVLLAEVIDRDAAATGRRREGVYYSVYGFINRLSGPLQALAFALLTPLFGYVSGENPGPNPEAAFRFLVAVVPGTAILLAYALTALFPHEVKE